MLEELQELTVNGVIEATKHAQLEEYASRPMSYSGRRMFGRECLGLRVNGSLCDALNYVLRLGAVIGEKYFLPEISIDNFGLGHVVYFKDLSCTRADFDKETEEDEDE